MALMPLLSPVPMLSLSLLSPLCLFLEFLPSPSSLDFRLPLVSLVPLQSLSMPLLSPSSCSAPYYRCPFCSLRAGCRSNPPSPQSALSFNSVLSPSLLNLPTSLLSYCLTATQRLRSCLPTVLPNWVRPYITDSLSLLFQLSLLSRQR